MSDLPPVRTRTRSIPWSPPIEAPSVVKRRRGPRGPYKVDGLRVFPYLAVSPVEQFFRLVGEDHFDATLDAMMRALSRLAFPVLKCRHQRRLVGYLATAPRRTGDIILDATIDQLLVGLRDHDGEDWHLPPLGLTVDQLDNAIAGLVELGLVVQHPARPGAYKLGLDFDFRPSPMSPTIRQVIAADHPAIVAQVKRLSRERAPEKAKRSNRRKIVEPIDEPAE